MPNTESIQAKLGDDAPAVQETLRSLANQRLPERLWNKDPSLWKDDPAVQEKIKDRLGWLNIVSEMVPKAEEITAFAQSLSAAGINTVVLLGMGGSSLCPEVLRQTFGIAEGYPNLIVLDTTDPATIRSAERAIDLKHSVFLLASKSGSTIEMQSLYRYFAAKVAVVTDGKIGPHFMAITDPGSPLEALAKEQTFRKIFLAPSDVGGRYAALTYFGLVPAALIGIDVPAFLKRAEAAIQKSLAPLPINNNEAIRLGAILGTLGKAGRDKVTLITSSSISSFGIWAEQLVAESTGKEGKGLVPIDGETIAPPEAYGKDRLFVYLRDSSDTNEALDEKVDRLENVGHPVVRISLGDRLDLAGQFFIWEMATAVAGAILEVNPFDEPNVTESKEMTAQVLCQFEQSGRLSLPDAVEVSDGIAISGNLKKDGPATLENALRHFLSKMEPQGYVALMAYLPLNAEYDSLLQRLRQKIHERYHIATTLGYGPRFLHSTGQLHKGGPAIGSFIQFTVDEAEDIAIPEVGYSFGVLKRAQALGDFLALGSHGLPVLDIRFGEEIEIGLQTLLSALE